MVGMRNRAKRSVTAPNELLATLSELAAAQNRSFSAVATDVWLAGLANLGVPVPASELVWSTRQAD
jgi:hypothetical protein